jgi:hypothetical protein
MVDHGPWMGKPNVGSCVGRRENTFAEKSGFAFTCQNDTSTVYSTTYKTAGAATKAA